NKRLASYNLLGHEVARKKGFNEATDMANFKLNKNEHYKKVKPNNQVRVEDSPR
ncbi:hypothetical protein SK128_003508, partial [Halocaridina rubra]